MRNQFDGDKNGVHWKKLVSGYLISKYPTIFKILDWAEKQRNTTISNELALSLQPWLDDDILVISHFLWGFFNVNLTGSAFEIFSNVPISNGLDVWRRLMNKVNDKSPARKDELLHLINNPGKTSKCEDMDKLLESWDTNLRIYRELGGEELSEDQKKHILKKMIPQILVDGMIMQNQNSTSFEALRQWIQEKAKAIATQNSLNHKQPALTLHREELADEDLDALLELDFEEAFAATGQDGTADNIFALQARFQKRRAFVSKGRGKGEKGKDKGSGKGLGKNGEKQLRCTNCGRRGHDGASCRQPKKDFKERPCYTCGKPGHLAVNCPDKPAGSVEEPAKP